MQHDAHVWDWIVEERGRRIAEFRAAALDMIVGRDTGDMLREADGWMALRRLIKSY